MNYASLESAKRWQKLGFFQDSEYVYARRTVILFPDKEDFDCFLIERFRFSENNTNSFKFNYKEIGPAPHCEELGLELWNRMIMQTRLDVREFEFYCGRKDFKSHPHKAFFENETEAREKAINWDLDQTHSQ